ncbi:GNAT family N-acetyltransferase [Agromyces sp. CFH 90414]|uniref:GNAT family N-acetyltransferase n=1 Tax=Agromyces agglutinans TaxID=2662258 RepID=A0A6I2FAW0_9MICO|nr:GNAT family N-acetyltransferase [Agromyces agglutinans]MRG59880.1 GNAT family N-acetyltransferase [Agromyces agglutinans]
MPLRPVDDRDRALLREATLGNLNWSGERISEAEFDATPELAHYATRFDARRDFGFVDEVADVEADDADDCRPLGVAWVIFLPADDPGYGYVADDVPEFSINVIAEARGRGVGARLVDAVVAEAERRGIRAISLSVEDGNHAQRLYERAGFVAVGRNGGSDTLLLELA